MIEVGMCKLLLSYTVDLAHLLCNTRPTYYYQIFFTVNLKKNILLKICQICQIYIIRDSILFLKLKLFFK